jgi:hypothetical protein
LDTNLFLKTILRIIFTLQSVNDASIRCILAFFIIVGFLYIYIFLHVYVYIRTFSTHMNPSVIHNMVYRATVRVRFSLLS